MKLRNNKGKATGSGTVSNARRGRYRKACEERDKFLETSTDIAKAKELQRANQKKPVGDGAASSMEVKDEKKGKRLHLVKRSKRLHLVKRSRVLHLAKRSRPKWKGRGKRLHLVKRSRPRSSRRWM